jgi:hypothetical protein
MFRPQQNTNAGPTFASTAWPTTGGPEPQTLAALPAWRELGSYRLHRLHRITRFRRQEKVFTRAELQERIYSLDFNYK